MAWEAKRVRKEEDGTRLQEERNSATGGEKLGYRRIVLRSRLHLS